jgi:hypothetical protein
MSPTILRKGVAIRLERRAIGGAALLGLGNIVDDIHPGQRGIEYFATVFCALVGGIVMDVGAASAAAASASASLNSHA